MAVHSENAAAPGRVVSARFPLREVVTIIGVVFTATSALIVGMQWAISNNLGPLFLAMQSIESHVLSTRKEVNVLHADVAVLRTEIEALRGLPGEVAGLRGEVGELRGLRADVADLRTEFGELRGLRADVADLRTEFGELRGLRADVADLRTEFGELRAEVSENRGQIVDLRERLARVETGLEQVQANQVRMLDILERGPQPRG